MPRSEAVLENYSEIDFVCFRPDGAIETPGTVSIMFRTVTKKMPRLEDVHFHRLHHPNAEHKN